jgi:hypothetical protein
MSFVVIFFDTLACSLQPLPLITRESKHHEWFCKRVIQRLDEDFEFPVKNDPDLDAELEINGKWPQPEEEEGDQEWPDVDMWIDSRVLNAAVFEECIYVLKNKGYGAEDALLAGKRIRFSDSQGVDQLLEFCSGHVLHPHSHKYSISLILEKILHLLNPVGATCVCSSFSISNFCSSSCLLLLQTAFAIALCQPRGMFVTDDNANARSFLKKLRVLEKRGESLHQGYRAMLKKQPAVNVGKQKKDVPKNKKRKQSVLQASDSAAKVAKKR